MFFSLKLKKMAPVDIPSPLLLSFIFSVAYVLKSFDNLFVMLDFGVVSSYRVYCVLFSGVLTDDLSHGAICAVVFAFIVCVKKYPAASWLPDIKS